MNHSENVFDNVKSLFRRAESLVIDPVAARRENCPECGTAQHERPQKSGSWEARNVREVGRGVDGESRT